MEEEIPLNPITGWDTGIVSAYGIAFIKFHYLVSPMESVAQAHPSPTYAMTPVQLRDLGQKLNWLADQLDATPPTSAGSQQH